MTRRKYAIGDYVTALAVLFAAIGMLMHSEKVSGGIAAGIEMCAGVLIPALFPFMILSCFLSETSAARILSAPLRPVTTKIFKLPEELGALVLMSFVGGYPVGAKNVSQLVKTGRISIKTAERMMCFCMNSGPSFLISAVGVKLLNDKTAGIILLLTQTAASVIIGCAVSRKAGIERAGITRVETRGAEAFVEAVSRASSAMLAMCSFAVIFSGILPLILASGAASPLGGALNAVAAGFFEVTTGCVRAAGLDGALGFGLISAMISFGGLSVLFQIMSCFRRTGVSMKPLIISRIFHAIFTTAASVSLYSFFCGSRVVPAVSLRPVVHTDARSLIIAALLLCMCAALTLSVRHSK